MASRMAPPPTRLGRRCEAGSADRATHSRIRRPALEAAQALRGLAQKGGDAGAVLGHHPPHADLRAGRQIVGARAAEAGELEGRQQARYLDRGRRCRVEIELAPRAAVPRAS
jgi:hypothetical protein